MQPARHEAISDAVVAMILTIMLVEIPDTRIEAALKRRHRRARGNTLRRHPA